ncbi:MAG: hypothetical protein Wins2KO_14290 [Winogradskyella sp.]
MLLSKCNGYSESYKRNTYYKIATLHFGWLVSKKASLRDAFLVEVCCLKDRLLLYEAYYVFNK